MNAEKSLRVTLIVLLTIGLITFIMIQIIRPSILPNELRIIRSTGIDEEIDVNDSGIDMDEMPVNNIDENVNETDIENKNSEVEISTNEIDFNNPTGNNGDKEVMALSSRPEMDMIRDRDDAIPQRLMGAVNGAIKLYRQQTASSSNDITGQIDITQFNASQTALM